MQKNSSKFFYKIVPSFFPYEMETRRVHWRAHLRNIEHLRRLYDKKVIHIDTSLLPDAEQINLDIPRTYADDEWFTPERQYEVKRMLKQYAAVYRGDGYIQGFNYVMTICYYVYGKDFIADAWWTFVNIISTVRPIIPDFNMKWFVWTREEWLKKFRKKIKSHRKNLWNLLEPHMAQLSHIILVKWILIWFAQTFSLEDVVYIWDALFLCKAQDRMNLYVALSVAIVNQASAKLFDASPTNLPGVFLEYRAEKPIQLIESARQYM